MVSRQLLNDPAEYFKPETQDWVKRNMVMLMGKDAIDETTDMVAFDAVAALAGGVALKVAGKIFSAVRNAETASKGGFTMPGGSPVGARFAAGDMIISEAQQIAQSALFVKRAKTLGYSDEALDALQVRLKSMQGGTIPTGGFTTENLFLIGERSLLSTRRQRFMHELGHVLDDVANPGLMSRSSEPGFGFKGFYRAESVAYKMQYGFNPMPLTAINAGMQSNPLLTMGIVGGIAMAPPILFGW